MKKIIFAVVFLKFLCFFLVFGPRMPENDENVVVFIRFYLVGSWGYLSRPPLSAGEDISESGLCGW